MSTTLTPRREAERVLGSAVHPRSLDRLFELWPEASVTVLHAPADARWDGQPARYTKVMIKEREPGVDEDGTVVLAHARCHPDDQFDRKRGITLAFNRALKAIPR